MAGLWGGSETCRIVAETDPTVLKAPVLNLGMAPSPCPTAKALEDIYYPDLHRTIDSVARLVRQETMVFLFLLICR